MALPSAILMYGDRASQPAAGPENDGVYYRVTDEGDIVEQSDGANWVPIASSASGIAQNDVVNGRLTLRSGDPVPAIDLVGLSDLFFTPYKGNRISLYTGSAWANIAFAELSLTLAALTSGAAYDVFIDYNGGAPQIVLSAAWVNQGQAITNATNASPIVVTSNTHGMANGDQVYISGVGGNLAANGFWTVANVTGNTYELSGSTGSGAYTSGGWMIGRAAAGALVLQDEVYVLTGAADHRWVGTIKAVSTTTTTDAENLRYVWNYYNQVPRSMRRIYATTYNYAINAIREQNGASTERLQFIRGIDEQQVQFIITTIVEENGGGGTGSVSIGVGFDSVTAFDPFGSASTTRLTAFNYAMVQCLSRNMPPGAGHHFVTMLERVETGTVAMNSATSGSSRALRGTVWG